MTIRSLRILAIPSCPGRGFELSLGRHRGPPRLGSRSRQQVPIVGAAVPSLVPLSAQGTRAARTARKLPGGDIFLDLLFAGLRPWWTRPCRRSNHNLQARVARAFREVFGQAEATAGMRGARASRASMPPLGPTQAARHRRPYTEARHKRPTKKDGPGGTVLAAKVSGAVALDRVVH